MRSTVLRAVLASEQARARAATPGFAGQVHSVFRGALNVVSEGSLLTIAHEALGGLPNGVSVRTDVDLRAQGLSAGLAVEGDGRRLSIRGGALAIDLAGAVTWSPRLPERHLAAPSPDRIAAAWEAAVERAPEGGFGPLIASFGAGTGDALADPSGIVCRRAEPAIRALVGGLRGGDTGASIDAGTRLLGLGPGLTPSGDDLLVGLCAALWASAQPAAPALSGAWSSFAPGRTTLVAEALLWHAARGEFSERLHGLLAALFDGPADAVADSVERSLAWGATSGADCLLGVLLGLGTV